MLNAQSLLKNIYLERKKRNPSYSLSALARDLGLSVSFLSRLVHGQRPLTPALATQLAPLLKLSKTETEQLISECAIKQSKSKKLAEKSIQAKAKQGFGLPSSIEVEQFRAISEWYHFAILSLTRVKGFQSDPKWIAGRLGISLIQTKDAIDRLLLLGLLESNQNQLKPTHKSLFVKTDKSSRAIREYQFSMIEQARNELLKTDQESFSSRYIAGSAIALDSKKIETFKERLKAFQLELADLAADQHCDSVYHLNLQFFKITKNQTPTSQENES